MPGKLLSLQGIMEQGVIKGLLKLLGGLLAVIVLCVLVLLAGIWVEGRPASGPAQYVALGSSFASGPGISERAPGAPHLCGRSQDNYAHQLARKRGLALMDVTCGGATTKNILEGGQFMQGSQLDALRPETELVTVTIGGNDINYMGQLIALGCDDKTPGWLRAIGGCKPKTPEEVDAALAKLPQSMQRIAQQVRQRSPKARLVFLTYQTVMPASGSCERLGLTDEEAAGIRPIEQRLAAVTRAAAQSVNAEALDAAALTQGHDTCAPEPWMTSRLDKVPLHTTLAGMTAIANGLDALLSVPAPQ